MASTPPLDHPFSAGCRLYNDVAQRTDSATPRSFYLVSIEKAPSISLFNLIQGIFNEAISSKIKNLIFGNERASNFSGIKAFENRAMGLITQGECMGGHSTCLRFVKKRSLKLSSSSSSLESVS